MINFRKNPEDFLKLGIFGPIYGGISKFFEGTSREIFERIFRRYFEEIFVISSGGFYEGFYKEIFGEISGGAFDFESFLKQSLDDFMRELSHGFQNSEDFKEKPVESYLRKFLDTFRKDAHKKIKKKKNSETMHGRC